MQRPAAILIPAAAGLALVWLAPSCHPKNRVPGWVLAAPSDSLASLSGKLAGCSPTRTSNP